jgi:hypothetical protein
VTHRSEGKLAQGMDSWESVVQHSPPLSLWTASFISDYRQRRDDLQIREKSLVKESPERRPIEEPAKRADMYVILESSKRHGANLYVYQPRTSPKIEIVYYGWNIQSTYVKCTL